MSRETIKSYFGPYGLGQSNYSGPSKSVVRDRCWRSSHQGESAHLLAKEQELIVDLGSGFGRVEVVIDGTHLDYSRTRGFRQTSVHVLLCRRQSELAIDKR